MDALATRKSGSLHTRMVVLEGGQVVHIAIDNDVQVVGLVVRRNVAYSEGLGHCGREGGRIGMGITLRKRGKKGRRGTKHRDWEEWERCIGMKGI